MRVLLVLEDPSAAGSLKEAMVARGHRADVALPVLAESARSDPRFAAADLIVADVDVVERTGLATTIATMSPGTELVLVGPRPAAGHADVLDCIDRPIDAERLFGIVDELADVLEGERQRGAVDLLAHETVFAGDSDAIRDLQRRVRLVARSEAPVWVFGEDGTGRAIVARAIHDRGRRRREPFVALNTAAHPDEQFSRLLFQGERAAVVRAQAGTLFLERISAAGPVAQRELVRYLESRSADGPGPRLIVGIERVGSAEGQELLSSDLYFRLKVLEVEIPALNERARDLPQIAERMLRRMSNGTGAPALSPQALQILERYRFPGNLLELAHALTHAIVLARGQEIEPQHLPPSILQAVEAQPAPSTNGHGATELESLDVVAKRFERDYLLRVLRTVGGNRGRAAEILGLSRKGLWGKLKAHGISDDDIDRDEAT